MELKTENIKYKELDGLKVYYCESSEVQETVLVTYFPKNKLKEVCMKIRKIHNTF